MKKPKIKDLNKELKLKCLVKGYKGTYFEIGQIWETREGNRLKVKYFNFKPKFYKLTITEINISKKEFYYTLKGEYVKGKESDFDLIKLISTEVQTESTPTEDIQSKTLS